ncbi:MAG: C10 family peptidase [Paludibacteraceae bacterium]|nr:C10 family peptidase [Paludibacteraceae bacterium]
MKKLLTFVLTLAVCAYSWADLRTDAEICRVAGEYLSTMNATNRVPAKRKASAASPEILSRYDLFSIAGYREGGFVLVCADDIAPAVWGYSDGVVGDSIPSNMAWWLDEMSKMVREAKQPIRALSIPEGLPSSVNSLVSAQWGQHAPFNLWHVYGSYEYLTGCVATSMAQIMYSHRYPERGRGQHSYTYNNQQFSVDFSQSTYDWASMTDTYVGSYSVTSSTYAVATLMRDCGYAVNMWYGTSSSGAADTDIAAALRNYFGYNKYTRSIAREMFTAEQWQEILFTELSKGNAVSYGGVDPYGGGGHQFIVDGYRNDGFVHVNWGWTGNSDGYYAIASMNPTGYQFSSDQSMVIGIQPETEQLYHKTIAVTSPGTLRNQLTDYDMTHLQSLKVSGNLNGADITTIRALMGFAVNQGEYTGGQLTALNMEDANIIADNTNAYFNKNSTKYYLKAKTLPVAFLSDLAQWEYAGLSELILPASLTKIEQLAMPLCFGLTSVTIPAEVTSLGSQAFFCTDAHFKTIISHADTPPAWEDDDVFGDDDVVFREATLYVPAGSLQAYQQHTYWSQFQNIRELNSTGGLNINVPSSITNWQDNTGASADWQYLQMEGSGTGDDYQNYTWKLYLKIPSLSGTFTEEDIDWEKSYIQADGDALSFTSASLTLAASASGVDVSCRFVCENGNAIVITARKSIATSTGQFMAYKFGTNDVITSKKYQDQYWNYNNNQFIVFQVYNNTDRTTHNYCRLSFWVNDFTHSYNGLLGPAEGEYTVPAQGTTTSFTYNNETYWELAGIDGTGVNKYVVGIDNQGQYTYSSYGADLSQTSNISNLVAMADCKVIVESGKDDNIYIRVVTADGTTWCTIGEPKAEPHTFQVFTNGQGSVTVTPNQSLYSPNTEITLTPIAEIGWHFANWTGAIADQITQGTDDVYTYTMGTTNVSVTANFALNTYNLTYTGLEGATHNNPTTYTIETETITLSAPSERTGYTFTGWTCGGETITEITKGSMGNKEIVANWAQQTFTVNIESNNSDYGTVDVASVAEVPYGTVITTDNDKVTINGTTVTATPATATDQYTYAFTGWTNGTVIVTKDTTITANFTATPVSTTFTLEDQYDAGENYYATLEDFVGGNEKDVTYARTFQGGSAETPYWNVFSLPFDYMLAGRSHPFAGKVLDLSSASYDVVNDEVILNFLYETYQIEANKPYALINKGGEIVNPEFEDVTFETLGENRYSVPCTTGGTVTFVNTTCRQLMEADNRNILFIGNNQLLYPGEEAYLRAFRGYFLLENVWPQNNAPKRVRLMIEGESVATGLSTEFAPEVQSAKRIEDGVLIIERNGNRYDAQGKEMK